MSYEELTSNDRRVIAAALDILEKLTNRLDTGEPVPNALLADAVDGLRFLTAELHDRREQESTAPRGTAQPGAVQAQVNEAELALEALERGEAGAAGAFVIHARACVRLLRHAGLESKLVPHPTWTSAQSSMMRHFTRLLEHYARWTAGGHALL